MAQQDTTVQSIIGKHLRGLRSHLRARLKCEDDAHDIAQEACLRFLNAKVQRRHGLPLAEIAERMNLSRGMVKKYLAGGLAHFRKRLRRFALADART